MTLTGAFRRDKGGYCEGLQQMLKNIKMWVVSILLAIDPGILVAHGMFKGFPKEIILMTCPVWGSDMKSALALERKSSLLHASESLPLRCSLIFDFLLGSKMQFVLLFECFRKTSFVLYQNNFCSEKASY